MVAAKKPARRPVGVKPKPKASAQKNKVIKKLGADHWFSKLSEAAQYKYAKQHPTSIYAKLVNSYAHKMATMTPRQKANHAARQEKHWAESDKLQDKIDEAEGDYANALEANERGGNEEAVKRAEERVKAAYQAHREHGMPKKRKKTTA